MDMPDELHEVAYRNRVVSLRLRCKIGLCQQFEEFNGIRSQLSNLGQVRPDRVFLFLHASMAEMQPRVSLFYHLPPVVALLSFDDR